MPLVTMVHLRTNAEVTQRADTAQSQQQLLLQPVLPIASVEMVGNLTVLRNVRLIVRVEEVQIRPSDSHLPDAGGDVTSRKSHAGGQPITCGIQDRLRRDPQEILRVVAGHLFPLPGEDLGEVAISVQQPDRNQVHIHVAGFL